MISYRSTQHEFDGLEPLSIQRMKKWTAISCSVIVVIARIMWGFSH